MVTSKEEGEQKKGTSFVLPVCAQSHPKSSRHRLCTLRLHPTSQHPQRPLACLQISFTCAAVPSLTHPHAGSTVLALEIDLRWHLQCGGVGARGILGTRVRELEETACCHVVWMRSPQNFQGNPEASQKGSEGDQECGPLWPCHRGRRGDNWERWLSPEKAQLRLSRELPVDIAPPCGR